MNKNNQDKEFGLLSLEQQFQLQILAIEIEHLTLEEAKKYLRDAFRQIMLEKNLCREMLKECYF